MDALAGLLEGPQPHGAFLLRCLFDPPFCLRIEDEAPLALTAVALRVLPHLLVLTARDWATPLVAPSPRRPACCGRRWRAASPSSSGSRR